MAKVAFAPVESSIPGVRPADQARSRALQNKFVKAAQTMLLKERLSDISVPALARRARSSVGGFYSRFHSKEAFFEFLRGRMLDENGRLYDEALDPARFAGKERREICTAFIDVMIQAFSGPWRGVLREAYASIPENQGSWTPSRVRGQLLRDRMKALLAGHLKNVDDGMDRVAFAVQLLFSALNNELMNPNLSFSITHPQFREYLIEAFDQLVSGVQTP